MNYVDYLLESIRNLYCAKLRSLLALLGVLVGTASVVAMVSGVEFATDEAMRQFKSLGTDLLAVSVDRMQRLSLQQALDLAKTDSAILQVAPYTQLFEPIYYAGHPINATTLGVTDHFAALVNINMQAGRFVSSLDQYEQYCVIGRDVYHQLLQYTMVEPLGKRLQIGNHIFIIIGIADSWAENNFVYANVNKSILIPLLTSTVVSHDVVISNVIMRLQANADIAHVESRITSGVDAHVEFRSAKELIAAMEKQGDILTLLLGLIGGIALIVGGIGVMNIMLVSVAERRREIGIRLAMGATSIDIGLLFLTEAALLALIGGILGILVGLMIAYVITVLWQWQFVWHGWPILSGFLVAVLTGVFFGFYPAYLAAKLHPIVALRAE